MAALIAQAAGPRVMARPDFEHGVECNSLNYLTSQCENCDALWADIVESSGRVFAQAIGLVPDFEFAAVVVEWIMVDDEDRMPADLFSLSEIDMQEGVFVSCVLAGHDFELLAFEPIGPLQDMPVSETQAILVDLGINTNELTLLRSGVIQAVVMGQAGVVEGVHLLVVEWAGSFIGTGTAVTVYPFMDQLTGDEVGEFQQAILPTIVIGIGAGILVWGITDVIIRERDRVQCDKDSIRMMQGCLGKCVPLKYMHCSELPDGEPCPIRVRCVKCCEEVYRQHGLRGLCSSVIPGNWAPWQQDCDDCWENADNPDYPLPGDPLHN